MNRKRSTAAASAPAIFLDAGHTLLRPACSIGRVYAQVADHYGVRADAGILDAGFKKAWQAMKVPEPVLQESSLGARRDEKNWWKELVRMSWSEVENFESLPFDDYFETVYRAFAQPGLWRVYPDAWGLLEWIRERHIFCGILSNWDERLRPVLQGHQLNDYFSLIVISGELGVAKPDPEIFRHAQESAQQIMHVSECILIGDDDDIDGAGARRAGWEYLQVDRPSCGLDQITHMLRSRYED